MWGIVQECFIEVYQTFIFTYYTFVPESCVSGGILDALGAIYVLDGLPPPNYASHALLKFDHALFHLLILGSIIFL